MEVKTKLAKDCNNINSTCSLHIINPQLLKQKNICLYLLFWSSEVKYVCRFNMFLCKYTSFLTGGSSTHKTSAGTRKCSVRCPASADLLIYFGKFLALFRHRTMPYRAPFEFYTKIVRCPSDVCKRRPCAVGTPYGPRSLSP